MCISIYLINGGANEESSETGGSYFKLSVVMAILCSFLFTAKGALLKYHTEQGYEAS